jgi:uncharacterized protein YndB with AHSA1/START domain
MSSNLTDTPYKLELRRVFKAPPQAIFNLWTTAEGIKKWHRPAENFQTTVAEVDLRVGGKYRICMQNPEGGTHCVGGVYTEIVAPSRLAFTWIWENDAMGAGESLVTVELHDRDGSTEIILHHERFASEEAMGMHRQGWTGCLDQLERLIAA